jgi:hypothetical protein
MINSSQIKRTLQDAIEASLNSDSQSPKMVLLDYLNEHRLEMEQLERQFLVSWDFVGDLISSRSRYPVSYSRLQVSDLSRRLNSDSWGKLRAAVYAYRRIVEDSVIMTAGDCNHCDGDELAYMLNRNDDSIVRYCELCSYATTLDGTQLEPGGQTFRIPFTEELERAGVLKR